MAILFLFLAILLPSPKVVELKESTSIQNFDLEIPQPGIVLYFKFVEEKADYISKEGKVEISWSSSGNPLISHFEIERSEDKNLDFKTIGTLPLQNWDEEMADYRFEDSRLPLSGGRIYYRIKQIGSNGNFQYGKTLSVEVLPTLRNNEEVWRSFPNPVKNGNLQVDLLDNTGYRGEQISIRVIQSGNVLMSRNCADVKELNDFLANSFNNVSSGLILVELKWGMQAQYLKVWNLR
ncbi:hypothetical protein MMU07_12185 [Aquiflexum sp. LQ15W]|uniref:hypothetical protein n=1 Tax=Cognataquiflexum nitidum TaxID=2922272 RepID=UPI001F138E1A|nr:hypothetical protein [Cognataquiflexum nitidum]MCH6200341.1 hypothetical protein [Cognataquiflexum nitidum]